MSSKRDSALRSLEELEAQVYLIGACVYSSQMLGLEARAQRLSPFVSKQGMARREYLLNAE
jgi:hypothetical protein